MIMRGDDVTFKSQNICILIFVQVKLIKIYYDIVKLSWKIQNLIGRHNTWNFSANSTIVHENKAKWSL